MGIQVNSWTEWGPLELVVIGSAKNMCYPDESPVHPWHNVTGELHGYVDSFYGPRHRTRIELAQAQLDNLANIIRSECIQVNIIKELEKDIGEELERYRSIPITNGSGEKKLESITIQKSKIQVWNVTSSDNVRFDLDIRTPHFTSKYQFGLACPRDMLITLGDTIVEAPTAEFPRYFESTYYKPLLYFLWSQDNNMKWIQPPKPTCSITTMFDRMDYWHESDAKKLSYFPTRAYKTNLNESEIAFDAADLMRMGKDIFYKRSGSTTIKGLDWIGFVEHFHICVFIWPTFLTTTVLI